MEKNYWKKSLKKLLKKMKRLKYKNKVVIVTSSRAEYGLLAKFDKIIAESKQKFDLELVVIGQHLSKKYGMTFKSVF